jgi:hypothetical protein
LYDSGRLRQLKKTHLRSVQRFLLDQQLDCSLSGNSAASAGLGGSSKGTHQEKAMVRFYLQQLSEANCTNEILSFNVCLQEALGQAFDIC